MKKRSCLLLALCLLIFSLPSCLSTEQPDTETTVVTTAAPDPLAFLEDQPQEYVDWWNSLNLPAELPTQTLSYTVLLKNDFSPFVSSNRYVGEGFALISSTQDLDAFLQLPTETVYTKDRSLEPFDQALRHVDYTHYSVLIIGHLYDFTTNMSLKQILVHGNYLITEYIDPYRTDNGMDGEVETKSFCYALMIEKDALQTMGEDLQIVYFESFPTFQEKTIYGSNYKYPFVSRPVRRISLVPQS